MSGQLSAATRFLREAVAEIANRVIAETNFGLISDSDHQLVALKVKKWVKQNGGMHEVSSILWGTQLSSWELFDGDFAGDTHRWLSAWGVGNEHRSDADRRLMYHTESFKQHVRISAFLVLCAEVMMLLAHRDQLFSEHDELDSWRALYNSHHEFEDTA